MQVLLGKNDSGYEFAKQLNILPQTLADRTSRINLSMIAAMTLPHLVLAKSKDSYDGSIAQTISRRLSQKKRVDMENLFNEAKALQFRLSKN